MTVCVAAHEAAWLQDTNSGLGTEVSSQSPPYVLILEDDDLLRDRVPDIVVLDIGLPDTDGFDVARRLRAKASGIGIVMLTARSEPHYQVRGLSEGADVYLAKPVDIDVLAATLYSLARRLQLTTAVSVDHSWRLGADGWCLLSPAGHPVALSQLESRLLALLIESPNRIVSREALIQAVTPNVHTYDPHRLDTLVHRIRKKVMRVLGTPFPLNAVPGQGYVLVFH